MTAEADSNYWVDVIGFNPTERHLLASIFGLAARRTPGFLQRDPDSAQLGDLYLVDADDDQAFSEYQAITSRRGAPAVLVGASDRGTGLPLVPRPMRWAQLLQAFDDAVTVPAPAAEAQDYEKTKVLRRTLTMPGQGATPAPRAAPAAAPAARIPPRSAAPAAAKRITDSVLVVDDNATVRKFMEAKLAPYGFHVDFAETGEEAVGLTGTNEYTCVFLDVVLPGIDGYQVCKLIKSNKQAIKRTAVVMLTGRTGRLDKLRGSMAGCDSYLTKPVDENELLEVIAKFLPSSRAAAG
jgi:two-component system cell cycle response regulator